MDVDPFEVFAAWWREQHVPMVLATAGPSARAVVLDEFDHRGFPERFEFWTAKADYVHDRFEYRRRRDGWQRRRLQP